MDGVGTDEWTARHVHDRRDRTMAELLQEWDEHGTAVEAMVDSFGEAGGQLVTDASRTNTTSAARWALPARDSEGVDVACTWIGTRIGEALDQATAGAWRVEHDAGACTFGSGEPVATLRATRFEIVRAATGRRSREQIAAYAWEGDARQDLLVLGPFTPALRRWRSRAGRRCCCRSRSHRSGIVASRCSGPGPSCPTSGRGWRRSASGSSSPAAPARPGGQGSSPPPDSCRPRCWHRWAERSPTACLAADCS